MHKLFVGILLLLFSAVAHATNPACQAGTAVFTNFTDGQWCVKCLDTWPGTSPTDNEYNYDFSKASDCSTAITWQFAAHVIAYSDNMGTNGTGGACDNATFFPNIHSHHADFANWTQAYPPQELGYYTSPAPHDKSMSRWSKFTINTADANGTYGQPQSIARLQIDFCENPTDADNLRFTGEDASTGNTMAVQDSSDTPQYGAHELGCGENPLAGSFADELPLQENSSSLYADSPAEIFCNSYYGGAAVTSSTWSPTVAKDANNDFPVEFFMNVATPWVDSDPAQKLIGTGSIYHDGGAAAWPECTVYYRMSLIKN